MTDPDYFTLAELRALPDMASETKYADARVLAAAAHVTSIIEREVNTSFVARTITDEVHDGGSDRIALDKPYVLSVTSATEDGAAVTDTLSVKGGILFRFSSGSYTPVTWASGTRNVAVTYEAGYSSTPPADIKEAALYATRARLLSTTSDSMMNDRRTSMSTDVGVVSFVVAGPDRPTGYPEVDAVILGWKAKLNNFGFA